MALSMNLFAVASVLFVYVLQIVRAFPPPAVYYWGNGKGYTSVPEGILDNTTHLILGGNEITSIDPDQLAHIEILLHIDLSRNNFSEFPDLCSFGFLRMFVIQYNAKPLAVPVERLACFLYLKWFYAIGTVLVSFPDFSQTVSLTNINLHGTEIPEVMADHLQGLDVLEELILSDNQLTSVPTFPSLPALKTLSLAVNQLSAIPSLGNLPSLTTLFLNSNGLSTIPDFCQYASSLEKLVLESNPISAFNQTRLDCLNNLNHLNLRDTLTIDISHLSFSAMTSTLKELLLGLNNVTFLPRFPNMKNLTLFNINDCGNLNLARNYFIDQNWTSLRELYIGGLANKILPDLSELGTTLQVLHLTPLDVVSLDVSVFAALTHVTHLKAEISPFSFLPTTCPSDPSGVSVAVSGSSLDLCAAKNLWLKMLEERGGSVQADDRTCGSHLWSTMTVNELLEMDTTVPEWRGSRARLMKTGLFCGFPLHSHHTATSLTKCSKLCLQTPGCYSFNFRPLGHKSGECLIVAPSGGQTVNYAPTDLDAWRFYEMTDEPI